MPNVNSQTIYQMGNVVNDIVKQATGRDVVKAIEMSHVTVEQNKLMGIETYSGSLASFVTPKSVSLRTLVAQIVAQQDLNGYGFPWSAGGNPHNKIVSIISSANINSGGIIESAPEFNIAIAPVTIGETYIARSTSTGLAGSLVMAYFETIPDINSVSYNNSSIVSGPNPFTAEITGYVAFRITKDTPNVQVNDGSTLDDYVPYSNICPITGWTGANVNRTGVNVWDEQWEVGGVSGQTGQNVATTGTIRSKNYISVVPGGKYYFKSPVNCWWHSYAADKSYLGVINLGSSFKNAEKTLGNNVYFLRFQGNAYGSTYKNDISVNYPSTDTEYHSGTQNETYPITFPSEAGTVYGGTLDVINGILTVTDAVIASYAGEELPSTWISDRDVYAEGATPTTGAQVVYKLAEPLTYELTPQQITTLAGQNNVWADTGDVSLSYYVYFDLL